MLEFLETIPMADKYELVCRIEDTVGSPDTDQLVEYTQDSERRDIVLRVIREFLTESFQYVFQDDTGAQLCEDDAPELVPLTYVDTSVRIHSPDTTQKITVL